MRTQLEFLLKNEGNIVIDDVFAFFENTEDIILIKYDGVRKGNSYTIVLMGKESRFEPIRYEGNNMQIGIYKVLSKYNNLIGNVSD